jgi:hypothetical protein
MKGKDFKHPIVWLSDHQFGPATGRFQNSEVNGDAVSSLRDEVEL